MPGTAQPTRPRGARSSTSTSAALLPELSRRLPVVVACVERGGWCVRQVRWCVRSIRASSSNRACLLSINSHVSSSSSSFMRVETPDRPGSSRKSGVPRWRIRSNETRSETGASDRRRGEQPESAVAARAPRPGEGESGGASRIYGRSCGDSRDPAALARSGPFSGPSRRRGVVADAGAGARRWRSGSGCARCASCSVAGGKPRPGDM